MYCAKCGVKIKPGKARCDKCGAPAPEPDYCGGFWGLLSKPESAGGEAADSSGFSYNTWSGARTVKEEPRGRTETAKRTGGVPIEDPGKYFWSRAAIPAIAAAALFLVILIVVSVRGGGERTRLQDELLKQENDMQVLKDQVAELEKTVGDLSSANEELEKDKAGLETRVDELETENRRLMRHNLDESRQGGTENGTENTTEEPMEMPAENTTEEKTYGKQL